MILMEHPYDDYVGSDTAAKLTVMTVGIHSLHVLSGDQRCRALPMSLICSWDHGHAFSTQYVLRIHPEPA